MIPQLSGFNSDEGGIKRVVESYHRYAGEYGIEYVDCHLNDVEKYDVFAVHAGSYNRLPPNKPIICHAHGVYWTADYTAQSWEWAVNAKVIDSARRATTITVPSNWVAETIRRDMRIDPVVIPHGLEWEEWDNDSKSSGYVLWNKNRNADVCSPHYVGVLAQNRPDLTFITTFRPESFGVMSNVKETGVIPHEEMKSLIQRAGIYLSTTKETFGIGILEAMASGVPVLGFAQGGILDLVEHGVSGYLAQPNNEEDLIKGLGYVVKFRTTLGDNARRLVQEFTWPNSMKMLGKVYQDAFDTWNDEQRPMVL